MPSYSLLDQTLLPGEPMWSRVPTRDEHGRSLHDFMMLIPRVGRWPELRRQQALQRLSSVMSEFGEQVVFADLNLRLNLLWVSTRPHVDGCSPLVAAIRTQVPEAVLVANQYEVMLGAASRRARRDSWFRRLLPGGDPRG
ncbi:MAG: hypothetical protein KDI68_06665 [Gammaproteobacteria bacterium]|nr:hypothetical protein [Gammaproteobacteria bacterium]